MIEYLVSQIDQLTTMARDNYGVNPVIFVILYVGFLPLFYYSLFRTLRALKQKLGNQLMLWSAILLFASVAPFLYVLVFGRNLPWWVYGVIAILIGQGVVSIIMKLRKKPADATNVSDG